MSKTKKVLIIIIFLIGLAILSYPFINNYINNKTQTQVINEYEKTLEEMDQEQIESMRQAAEEYNNRLSGNGNKIATTESSGKSYADLLNVGEVIGYISIPKIDVKLPIYHGTSETVLSKGVGHLETSSLPIGGESTHAVLTGHRGLPTAKLFTDLDKIEIGDSFYLEVLGSTLKYQVDQIVVVLPEDTDDLEIIEGEDYVTLITCTPYMINSHRLLVRGIRVKNDIVIPDNTNSEVVTDEIISIESNTNQRIIIYLYIFMIITDLATIFVIIKNKKKQKDKDVIVVKNNNIQIVDDLILDDIIEIKKPEYPIDINDFITENMCYTLYSSIKIPEISSTDEEILVPIIINDEEEKISIKVDGPYLREIINNKPNINKKPIVHKSNKKVTTRKKKYKKILFIGSVITGTIILSEILKKRRNK